MSFKLTRKQDEANRLLASLARNIMLFGGSRSGKTFLIVRAIVVRALKAPGSRHVSLRYRFGHIKSSIVYDTFPAVMKRCFPNVQYELNRTDWFVRFLGYESEYWFGGLDDKERTEKILGNEYATIHLNECSQIPFHSRNMAVTRLAQLVYESEQVARLKDAEPRALPLKMYYDENPPDKAHWTYKLFVSKQDPDTKRPLERPEDYASIRMNPADNRENLPPEYIKTLESLPKRLQTRFLEGLFREAAPNALFIDEVLERWRAVDDIPEMQRIVIAIDPSGADDVDNQDNDEIGIMVGGLGIDGNGYVLEDLTCKAGPATWGRIATQAYERHEANLIVAEVNFGGAMVKHVIHTARPRTPFKMVTASRGKAVRAEPIAALMETGKVRLAGFFPRLEDELYGFTTHGYTGAHSPNRADALIWLMSELFPSILAVRKPKVEAEEIHEAPPRNDGLGWMA
jgi:predicted phage terminase large subunit-like protein